VQPWNQLGHQQVIEAHNKGYMTYGPQPFPHPAHSAPYWHQPPSMPMNHPQSQPAMTPYYGPRVQFKDPAHQHGIEQTVDQLARQVSRLNTMMSSNKSGSNHQQQWYVGGGAHKKGHGNAIPGAWPNNNDSSGPDDWASDEYFDNHNGDGTPQNPHYPQIHGNSSGQNQNSNGHNQTSKNRRAKGERHDSQSHNTRGSTQQSNGMNWGNPERDAQNDTGNQSSHNQGNGGRSWNSSSQQNVGENDPPQNVDTESAGLNQANAEQQSKCGCNNDWVSDGGQQDNSVGGTGDWDNQGNTTDSKSKTKKPKKHASPRGNTATPREPSYTRSYWKFPTAYHGNSNAGNSRTRERHVMPEEPIYTISEAKAKEAHIRHQVRPGVGNECSKQTYKPIYWDNLDKPYAVFRFHYRSRGMYQGLS
jgi:hypothetical protein